MFIEADEKDKQLFRTNNPKVVNGKVMLGLYVRASAVVKHQYMPMSLIPYSEEEGAGRDENAKDKLCLLFRLHADDWRKLKRHFGFTGKNEWWIYADEVTIHPDTWRLVQDYIMDKKNSNQQAIMRDMCTAGATMNVCRP